MNKILKKTSEEISKNFKNLTEDTEKYNSLISELNAKIQTVVDEFKEDNEGELIGLETNILSCSERLEMQSNEQIKLMESYMLNRSEKWHDSESCFGFTQWLEDWQEFNDLVTKTPNFDCFNGISISYEELIELPKFNR